MMCNNNEIYLKYIELEILSGKRLQTLELIKKWDLRVAQTISNIYTYKFEHTRTI